MRTEVRLLWVLVTTVGQVHINVIIACRMAQNKT